ncbi:hypothetical protein AT15_02490 [Kosmotoga arenicorallina S304]|uniref:CN hydrolase domain-containing protein n=1 Tax=Kosmotoga arenicorallina S304 TaxID=1453497 RepID=A0A182C7R5_9BACT|nr:nitrilase-related carbon-nitrogen hydrolase [Kosmotoga arenicorallina]OAA31713.1 hypothetical protein AT15_02490 [Kosmotoga arenicorallina S304]
MKVAGALFDPVYSDKEQSKLEAIDAFKEAANAGADLIVFPEMTLSGFTMNCPLHDPGDMSFFEELAKTNGIAVIYGTVLKVENCLYNTAVFYDPESNKRAVYFKRKLFRYAKEDEFYCSGKNSVQFSYQELKCSLLICYDLRFPELFRDTIGGELFFVIACWPKSRKLHWHTLLRARAIENQAFVIGVNRIGIDEKGVDYGQLSAVYDYYGKRLKPSIKTSKLLIWEISSQRIKKMYHWRKVFPVLKT